MQQSDNLTARIGRWSTQHRKTAIFGWLAFVLASVVIGMNLMPQKEIDPQTAGGPGESGQAAEALDGAFDEASTEQVLIQSTDLSANSTEFKSAVTDVTERLRETEGVDSIVSPYSNAGEISSDGHSALITFELPGESETRGGERQGLARRSRRSTRGAPGAHHRRGRRREHQQGDHREVERGDGDVDDDLPPADPHHPDVRVRRARCGGYPAASRAHQRRGDDGPAWPRQPHRTG